MEQLVQKHGDVQMLEQVQAAFKAALQVATDDGNANTGNAVADGLAAHEGRPALGDAATQGQEAWQATPLLQSVGAKRKRLQGTAGV